MSRNCSEIGRVGLPSGVEIGYVIRIRNDTGCPFAVTGSVTILPGRAVSFTWTTVGWVIERTLNP